MGWMAFSHVGEKHNKNRERERERRGRRKGKREGKGRDGRDLLGFLNVW